MPTTKLIIARHGNTFEKGETPRRVGAKTDIPLTQEGRNQGTRIGQYLRDNDLIPSTLFTSSLQRTIETAYMAMQETGKTLNMQKLSMFDEVNYGPDENKTEEEVIARIGEQAIKDWDEHAIAPDGWIVHPEDIKNDWLQFGLDIVNQLEGHTIMVVTSNGIARFAPYLTGDFEGFKKDNNIKLSTGALAYLEHDGENWHIKKWNVKP